MITKFQMLALSVILIIFAMLQVQAQHFAHGLTAAQVKDTLLEDEETLLTAKIFGRAPSFVDAEAMTVSEGYVLAQITDAFRGENHDLLLSYEVQGLGSSTNITWALVDTTITWTFADVNSRDITPRYFQTQEPRRLSDEEKVIVRFYYHCIEADPFYMMQSGAYRYNVEEIPGPYMWTEFRRLMLKHTGINVWDLWFDGDKLYVDLHSTEWMPFDWGSTGSFDRGQRLIKTIASLPGVASFEILVGGVPGYATSHFCFGWIAIVEDGRIARFDLLQ